MDLSTKEGRLYICPTPIGNLGDITIRTLEVLKSVDLIACEDTRDSGKLLSHYEIHTKLTSYHEHNRLQKGEKLIKELLSGKEVALISDAGMPGISDPGEDLVKLCIENGIDYTVLPGASAGITAIVGSGLDTGRYVFEGFIPKAGKERKERLEKIVLEDRTIIIYESPHNLKKTLSDLGELLGHRKMTITREISKKFEERIYTFTDEAVAEIDKTTIKGEFVLVIEGCSKEDIINENKKQFDGISIIEHLKMYEEKGYKGNEAKKKVAKDLGITKREVYAELLKEKDNG